MKKQTMVKETRGKYTYVDIIETETSENAPFGSYSGGLAKNKDH
jgi:hypothetical protein